MSVMVIKLIVMSDGDFIGDDDYCIGDADSDAEYMMMELTLFMVTANGDADSDPSEYNGDW